MYTVYPAVSSHTPWVRTVIPAVSTTCSATVKQTLFLSAGKAWSTWIKAECRRFFVLRVKHACRCLYFLERLYLEFLFWEAAAVIVVDTILGEVVAPGSHWKISMCMLTIDASYWYYQQVASLLHMKLLKERRIDTKLHQARSILSDLLRYISISLPNRLIATASITISHGIQLTESPDPTLRLWPSIGHCHWAQTWLHSLRRRFCLLHRLTVPTLIIKRTRVIRDWPWKALCFLQLINVSSFMCPDFISTSLSDKYSANVGRNQLHPATILIAKSFGPAFGVAQRQHLQWKYLGLSPADFGATTALAYTWHGM